MFEKLQPINKTPLTKNHQWVERLATKSGERHFPKNNISIYINKCTCKSERSLFIQ